MTAANIESQILYHKQKYYTGQAEISDAEFDALEDELRRINPDSHVLQIVGNPFLTEQKVQHSTPMLSLDKCRDPEDVLKWMKEDSCLVSFKLDGSSASLVYRNGILNVAKTRGDGAYGENITSHIQHLSIPLYIPKFADIEEVEVRGEICISKERFNVLSDEMERRNMDRPKSIRNIVAGLLHRETDQDLCKYLVFISYEILGADVLTPFREPVINWGAIFGSLDHKVSEAASKANNITTYNGNIIVSDVMPRLDNTQVFQIGKLKLLGDVGFYVPEPFGIPATIEAVEAMIEFYRNVSDEATYLYDGLVFAVDDVEAQLARGFTGHHPKGKMAFKFESEIKSTTVKDIIIDVGRTGQLSFVAVVEPIELSGAVVERVTLHNMKYIQDHQVNVGAKIEMTRSGEVIPKHVITLQPNGVFQLPNNCPVCDHPLSFTPSQVNLICHNPDCPAQIKARISHWISTLNIYDIGDTTIEKMWDSGLVKNIEDLYKITPAQLAGLDKLGEKSAYKILMNVQATKVIHIEKLLAGLGIEGLGRSVSKLLTQHFSDLNEMRCANFHQLNSIEGIGGVIASNIVEGLKVHGPFIDRMNFCIEYPSKVGSSFSGQTFVITGKLLNPRKKIQQWIEERGGKVSGSVSVKTSYLVCNEASSSSKYKKAQSLGVSIITERQLTDMGVI